MLSVDHHLYAVQSVVMFLQVFKSKFWWIFKMWVRTFSHKTIDLKDIPNEAELGLEKNHQRIFSDINIFRVISKNPFLLIFLWGICK